MSRSFHDPDAPASRERRRFSRVAFAAPADLVQANNIWSCQVQDLSLKGLLVQEPDDCKLAERQPVSVCVYLNEAVKIHMQVRLAWRREGLLGFTCQQIDMESISHLRRLVELNLGDDSAADRELFELSAEA